MIVLVAPAAIGSVRVHVTAPLQVHPVPLAEVALTPDGGVAMVRLARVSGCGRPNLCVMSHFGPVP